MNNKKALIFDIEKFAVHDGPGIRTVVFMKGCPLHCVWCHNPESQSFKAELFFNRTKCTNCGNCTAVCPAGSHKLFDGKHDFNREKCTSCGMCADNCPAEALKLSGVEMSVDEVMTEVLKDKIFYQNSGGGITLSGGEPLAHFDFSFALLTAAKSAGLHTAVETSGFAPREQIQKLFPLVDLWLWDIKCSPEKHKDLTGVPFEPILENLISVAAANGKIILRCPLVPGVNDEDAHMLNIARLANEVAGVQEIDLEPYHPMGEGKSSQLGRTESFHAAFASANDKLRWKNTISAHTQTPVHLY